MILTGILAVLFLASVAMWVWSKSDPDIGGYQKQSGWAAVVFFVLVIASTGFRIIPAGYVGVVTWFGEVENRTLEPGLQFITPIAEGVVEVETRVHGIHFENQGAASREYQDVFLTGTLNIHVDSDGAQDLYQRVGLDYADKLVNPFFSDIIKEVIPQYGIGEILQKRGEIRSRTVDTLNAKLNPYHITVDDVAIANISFSEAYTKAIEDKQVQEQRVLTEKQILEQRRITAQQQVVEAQGQAQAAIEKAKGDAEANRLLTESLSDILVQYVAIQKLNPNVRLVILPSDNGFILNLEDLQKEPQP